MQEMHVWSLGWQDSLEKEMATHSSILPEKSSDRSLGVRHDRAESRKYSSEQQRELKDFSLFGKLLKFRALC